MGITGLLPLLRGISRRVHLEQLAGKTVAIDAYSWLHKGIYGSCAVDLFHNRHNTRSRRESRQKAYELIEAKKDAQAYLFIQKSIDVTPKMAHLLMKELRSLNIDFIVAPYEADAQMAWLDQNGLVNAIITEDSDLLLFGCKRILFKLDKNGWADEIDSERLSECSSLPIVNYSMQKFRRMCILSGCDYLPSIKGMGLKTAHKYICKYHDTPRLMMALRAEWGDKMPPDYEQNFIKAELTFLHQRIFNLNLGKLDTLTPLEADLVIGRENFDFLGPDHAIKLAKDISTGHYCPVSHEPFTPIKHKAAIHSPLKSVHSNTSANLSLHHQQQQSQRSNISTLSAPQIKSNKRQLQQISKQISFATPRITMKPSNNFAYSTFGDCSEISKFALTYSLSSTSIKKKRKKLVKPKDQRSILEFFANKK